jgi:protein-S-isoprenylcysteine O-methyltransferase Ste14
MRGTAWLRRVARLRVPLGFAAAMLAFWIARPTPGSLVLGLLIMLPGEALRIWASGHIDKGREVTTSGPYRFTRHPLYLGSTILGIGFAVAAQRWPVTGLVAVYLGLTLLAAIRTEEAVLDERFDGAYSAYREGRIRDRVRRFRLTQAMANREHRAVFGLLLTAVILYLRL